MTRTTNARIAGFTFLFYIAIGITSMVLFGRATRGEGVAAKLASIAQHATDLRIAVLLTMLTSLCAWVLGVTLYAITREEDPDLAMLGFTCRVGEGLVGGISIKSSLGLLWVATATGAKAPDPQTAHVLGSYLLGGDGSGIGATFFALGSTLFAYLLLRGRMIPTPMAWLGVVASVVVVVAAPLVVAGFIADNWYIWMPMLAFEVTFALWLLIKGVAMPAPRQSAAPA
jgi:hypothetical protein